MKKIVVPLVLFICFMNTVSAGITLGSTSGENHLKLMKGDIGRFKTMFFNLGDNPLSLELTAEHPKDLKVEISPNKLTLNSEVTSDPNCVDCEWFILKDGRSYARVHPVYIYVKIPLGVTKNHYNLKITAIASDINEKETEGVTQSLVQVREFTFSIYVPGAITFEETTEKDDDEEDYGNEDLYEGIDLEEAWRKQQDQQRRDESESKGETGGEGDVIKDSGGSRSYEDTVGGKDSGFSADDKKSGEDTGLFGIKTDEKGRTEMKLPVGKVVLTQEQKETAIDLGLITLLVSIGSLVIRILK
ncbi:MAG: hypothetical protein U9Q22_07825 [Candidatus Altiarchaeota archaeon]|nr:hypothetical protein [Candidatus Altiarchaeota archaeon]